MHPKLFSQNGSCTAHTHHLKNGRDKMNEPQGFLMRGCSTYFLVKKELMRKLIARLNICGWSSQESFLSASNNNKILSLENISFSIQGHDKKANIFVQQIRSVPGY